MAGCSNTPRTCAPSGAQGPRTDLRARISLADVLAIVGMTAAAIGFGWYRSDQILVALAQIEARVVRLETVLDLAAVRARGAASGPPPPATPRDDIPAAWEALLRRHVEPEAHVH